MKATIKILIAVVALLFVGGLLASAVVKIRQAAARMTCHNNLRQFGLGLQSYASCNGDCFPFGTVQNTDLPPEARLSWYVDIFPRFIEGGVSTDFDRAK